MRAGLVLLAWLALAAPVRAASPPPDWLTFGGGLERTGANPAERALTPARAPHLRRGWHTRVSGAISTQPLAVHGVGGRDGAGGRDLVIVGTEHGDVAALDAAGGRVLWRRHTGSRVITPDCQASPDSRFGIRGTPAVDRAAGRVYVVSLDGRAWAFDLATGRSAPGWPTKPLFAAPANFVWGALALSRGRLYVPVGSLCDVGRYDGGIVSVDVAHPARRRRWRAMAGTSGWGAGIWGWGGASVDPLNGDLYVATGNAFGTPTEDGGHGEQVVRLTPGLRVVAANAPLRGPFEQGDRDFGTTPVLLDAKGCPPQLVALNKVGIAYLYDRDRIARGPRQSLVVGDPAGSEYGITLIGLPAWDARTRTLVLTSPSAPPGSSIGKGIRGYTLGRDCRLRLRWHRPFDGDAVGSAPTLAAGVAWIASGRSRRLRAFRLRDGKPLFARVLSRAAVFASPTVVGGRVYTGDWGGEVSVFRP